MEACEGGGGGGEELQHFFVAGKLKLEGKKGEIKLGFEFVRSHGGSSLCKLQRPFLWSFWRISSTAAAFLCIMSAGP